MKTQFLGSTTSARGVATFTILGAACLSIAGLAVAGCRGDGGAGGAAAAAGVKRPELNDQIKAIEDNPNMPPQAKQAALASMRSSFQQRGKQAPATLQGK